MPRHHRPPVVVACALVAGALAGCSQAPVPVGAAPAASSAAPAAAQPSAPDSAAPTPVPGDSTGASTGGGAGAVRRCETVQLSLSVAFDKGADPRGALLRFVNTGTDACRMTGFPGVDLLGPDDPTFGPTYQVPRASATVSTVTVAPGSTAHAVLHYLTPQEGTRWVPTRISVTPPDTTHQLSSAWPGVAVLRQDAATHPGTYIGAVVAGPGSLIELG